MSTYNPSKTEKKIQRSALMVTIVFYTILFGLLILGYQDNLIDAFPEGIMEWMDGIFEPGGGGEEEVKPQAKV